MLILWQTKEELLYLLNEGFFGQYSPALSIAGSMRTSSVVCGDESSVPSMTCHCKMPIPSACIMVATLQTQCKYHTI